MHSPPSESLLLRGNVVLPDGNVRDRYVLIRQGQIESVTRERPPQTGQLRCIETHRNDWVFPGLINLHTHSDYNILPLWETSVAPFDNRHQWRGLDEYKANVREVYKHMTARTRRTVLAVFAELQAVAGGTAVLEEAKDLDSDTDHPNSLLLCRDTSNPADLNLPNNRQILSIVDLFRPGNSTSASPAATRSLEKYLVLRKRGALQAALVHLAEGRTGVGTDRGVDGYSRREFESFMADPAFKDADAVRQVPLALVHCSGMDARNPAHVRFLRERGISVVWSPVSNLLLYGDTLDVEVLLAEGINVILGSDWSPSGSKHVWDEAKFARFYLDAIGATVSDEQIFRMVTSNAGEGLGLPSLGRIERGGLGDLFILRSPLESDNPLEVFFATTDQHVQATIIAGRPIYGARDLLGQFTEDLQPLPTKEGSTVVNKVVHLPSRIKIDVNRDITQLEGLLKGLPRPVKRSNLLASADKPYRRRIQRLKQDVVNLGWSVEEWRKKGPQDNAGCLPVPADSVRVWRGFKATGLPYAKFCEQLGTVFIPGTVQLLAPLGLTAYLPAVLPADHAPELPDEIALLFYESREVYQNSFATTAGRIQGLIHGPVFDASRSQSGFPKKLLDQLKTGDAYRLFEHQADWYLGICRVLVGTRKRHLKPHAFRDGILRAAKGLQQAPPPGLDAAILTVADDWIVYWEHLSEDSTLAPSGLLQRINDTIDVVMDSVATRAVVPSGLGNAHSGLAVEGGEFWNMKLDRRKLYRY